MMNDDELASLLRTKKRGIIEERYQIIQQNQPLKHELEVVLYATIGAFVCAAVLWMCGMLMLNAGCH